MIDEVVGWVGVRDDGAEGGVGVRMMECDWMRIVKRINEMMRVHGVIEMMTDGMKAETGLQYGDDWESASFPITIVLETRNQALIQSANYFKQPTTLTISLIIITITIQSYLIMG